MIYIFNKKKIFSYILACFFVLVLFTIPNRIIPENDIELVKVSTNVMNVIDDTEYND